MTLEQISYASQSIAALAVVVSLVYAALQFRIYTKSARQARFIAVQSDIQEFRRIIATDADCARIYRDGLADMNKLEAIDQWRFGALMQLVIANFMYVDEFREDFGEDADQNMRGILRRPGMRQWWARGRRTFASNTVAFIDRLLEADGPQAPDGAPRVQEPDEPVP